MADELTGINNKAAELGKIIAESEVFRKFRETHEQLIQDKEARDLLDMHEEIFLKVRSLEMEGNPIEPDDKHKLLEAQQKLHENKLLQDYALAQADFQEIMNSLTEKIHSFIQLPPLSEQPEQEED